MRITELIFEYPIDLVATEPQEPCRILDANTSTEIHRQQLFDKFNAQDLLITNDTLVEKRRVFSESGLEFLFLKELSSNEWEVLFPAKYVRNSDLISLPGDLKVQLLERGLPQKVQVSQKINSEYFNLYGELALPPYIQKARGDRHSNPQDENWYQTQWAANSGSAASPTASLHFSNEDLQILKDKGVQVAQITLHVGMGTFLPIKAENTDDHVMHAEYYQIPEATLKQIEITKAHGGRIWALGTTVARALESYARTGEKSGETNLFIQPGFEWRIVSGLLTNFHQPKSTLLLLVAAFAGSIEKVLDVYTYAIKNKFRLFSYGDLTVWIK